jgi:catechol 2,3-dioxygenase-like lactoylglutathione lyase family enzyme
MTIQLDHTIVPSRDKKAAARFFADIFGLTVTPGGGYFAQVRINETLTFDFAEDPDPPEGLHYAFHITDAEFDAILARVKAKGLAFGSEPDNPANGRLNRRRGGRGFYFKDPSGHLLEVMTVRETGS